MRNKKRFEILEESIKHQDKQIIQLKTQICLLEFAQNNKPKYEIGKEYENIKILSVEPEIRYGILGKIHGYYNYQVFRNDKIDSLCEDSLSDLIEEFRDLTKIIIKKGVIDSHSDIIAKDCIINYPGWNLSEEEEEEICKELDELNKNDSCRTINISGSNLNN